MDVLLRRIREIQHQLKLDDAEIELQESLL